MSEDCFSAEALRHYARAFAGSESVVSITRNNAGHINDTFVVELDSPGPRRFILQRINTQVFTDPLALMRNIESVTNFLREKIKRNGGNPAKETLTPWRTTDGHLLYEDEQGRVWRAFDLIEDAVTVQRATQPGQLYQSGRAFGKFQRLLGDFPAHELHPVIPNFHHTPLRLAAFERAVAQDVAGRAGSVQAEIDFVLSRGEDAGIVQALLDSGRLPLRVTHNDTKINNVMFDAHSGEAVCVIDLDTVMPGSLLFDFGDTIRSGVNTGDEDEPDLSKVHVSLEYYRAFAQGFLEQTATTMTVEEQELLPFSGKLITYECGLRFLTDYLQGDVYFQTHRPGHNLDRARTQFRLVEELEALEPTLRRIQQEVLCH